MGGRDRYYKSPRTADIARGSWGATGAHDALCARNAFGDWNVRSPARSEARAGYTIEDVAGPEERVFKSASLRMCGPVLSMHHCTDDRGRDCRDGHGPKEFVSVDLERLIARGWGGAV
jgi:hypothetical protein